MSVRLMMQENPEQVRRVMDALFMTMLIALVGLSLFPELAMAQDSEYGPKEGLLSDINKSGRGYWNIISTMVVWIGLGAMLVFMFMGLGRYIGWLAIVVGIAAFGDSILNFILTDMGGAQQGLAGESGGSASLEYIKGIAQGYV